MSGRGSRGNALVIQSGGPTPVFNRSLFGIVDEAVQLKAFPKIFGAIHGFEGLLSGNVTDLEPTSRSKWRRVARAPGAALGSTRAKLDGDDLPRVIDALSSREVGYCFIIGGNDSAENGHALGLAAKAAGHAISVLNVPKTIDNDLVLTDHSPGYGSAGRFVALATMGVGRDAEAMGRASPVAVVEVMGRDAGWLAASAALARREERDAPHVICVPEVPVDEERFVGLMEEAYRRFGFAVAVVAENARGVKGVLGGDEEPSYVDDFGHAYFDGPGRYLAALISRRLRVRARHEKPGTIQRSMVSCVSRTDASEAELAGRAAVGHALEGHADKMVTLVREPGPKYRCTTGLAPLAEVAGRVKTLPTEYLEAESYFVNEEFLDYARPLLGGPMPRLGRLP